MPRPAPVEVTREVDRLYTLPLAEFTGARDDLQRRLRALGAGEAADHVRRLRRPTITAWVLNRLSRAAPDLVAAVLDAGEAMRRLHEDLLSGQAVDLLSADRVLADAVTAAVDAARREADAQGVGGGAALADRLRTTLRAAALDPAVGDLVREGRLDHERTPPVLGGPVGMPAPPPRAPEVPAAPPEADPALIARLTEARERLDAAATAAAAAEAEEAAARREAAEARARHDRLRAEEHGAAAALAEAQDAREAAARALAQAEEALEAARRGHDEARRRAGAAEGEAARAGEGEAAAARRGDEARAALAAAEAAARALLGG